MQLAYAIGVDEPVSFIVNTFGAIKPEHIEPIIKKVFLLSAQSSCDQLNLKRPIYQKTAYGGHFGRNDPDFTWEKLDKVQSLLVFFGNSRTIGMK